MWPFGKKYKFRSKVVSVREGLANLAAIGISMRPDVTIDDLLYSTGGTIDDPIDYCDLLCILGGDVERGKFNRISDDIWHLDAECIVEDGDYASLLARFCILAKRDFSVVDVKDHVDIDAGEAWIDFTFNGQLYHWEIEVQDDWMDPGFYSKVSMLVRKATLEKSFFICAIGQDSLISYGTAEQKAKLSKLSGLAFAWE
jgi:hypothetical protein